MNNGKNLKVIYLRPLILSSLLITLGSSAEASRTVKEEEKAQIVRAEPARNENQKTHSRIVTAEMRANAVENLKREAWAAEQVRSLRNRLEGYLSASRETLWTLLPSQDFPRSSLIAPDGSLPAPYREMHESVRPSVSNGFGRSFQFHVDPLHHPWKVYSRGLERWLPDNDLGAYYRSGVNEQGDFRAELADSALLVAQADSPADAWIDDGTGAAVAGAKVFVAANYAYRV